VNSRVGDATAADRVKEPEIELQVDRLLSDNRFCNTRRLPSFLRFVITETIQGRGEFLKERTIGAAVFGRPIGYDTAGDPIVRVTAAELRKKLAQYYQDPGHESEIRISLPIGSYVPCFETSSSAASPRNDDNDRNISSIPEPGQGRDLRPKGTRDGGLTTTTNSRVKRGLLVCGSIALFGLPCVALALAFFAHRMQSPLQEFWAPVLNSSDEITFYLPYLPNEQVPNPSVPQEASNSSKVVQLPSPGMDAVVLADFRSFVTVTSFLESKHRNFVYKSSNTSTIADLQTGPAVIIGAFDNPWALRFSNALRFRFGNNSDMQEFWIEDSLSHPTVRWRVERKLQVTNNFCDYAIVARFVEQDTGKPVVLVAGITGPGTAAASQFIIDSEQLSRVPEAPRNWTQKNVEVVLKIDVIDRVPAAPEVVAAYFW